MCQTLSAINNNKYTNNNIINNETPPFEHPPPHWGGECHSCLYSKLESPAFIL